MREGPTEGPRRGDRQAVPSSEAARVAGDAPSTELLHMILSVMPDAAVVVDGDGTMVAANQQAGALFGHDPSALVGRPIEVLVPERHRARHRAHRTGYMAAPAVRSMGTELRLAGRRHDGSEFPIDVSLAPIGGDDRQLVVAAIRDVTERNAAAAAQARLATLVQTTQDGIVTLSTECVVTSWNPGAARLFGFAPTDIIGRHVSLLVPDEESEHLETLLAAGQAHRAAPAADTRWRRADGSLLDVAVSLSALDAAGDQPAGFSVIVRDATERKAAEALLAHRERWLRAMADIRLAILSGVSLDALVRLVTDQLGTLVPDSVVVMAVDEVGTLPLGQDTDDRTGGGRTVPVPSTALSLLVEADRPRTGRLTDLVSEVADDAPALAAALRAAAGDTAAIVVTAPVAGADRPAAALVVMGPVDAIAEDDIEAIGGLAEQVTLGLRLAQSRQREQQLVLADDRARIARDLHDHVIQALFAAGMRLQSALPLVADERAAGWMSDIVEELDETIGRIRTTIFSLESPRDRPAGGLRAAVLDLARAAAGQLGFEPDVRFAGPVETVPDPVRPHLLAVAREALSNAARHAAASRVALDVRVEGGEVAVVVTDNGRGLGDVERTSGLANARARARQLGGDLTLQPAPGGGTVFAWRIPL